MLLCPAPNTHFWGTFYLKYQAGYKNVTDDLLMFSKLSLKIYSQDKMQKGEGKNPRMF